MLHNPALRCQVPFLQEDEAGDERVAAVDPVDSKDEEDEDEDNRTAIIQQCVQFELSNVVLFCLSVCIFSAAVCTANGLLRLNVRCGDSLVIM
ncbi:hypothetical protein NDU88_001114 [Pleurodeles waltl]|uniref:Uncharacterized protein n=1 Tax=Pleurodeles waltl TaxID=8319 RepID=A0AAV7LBU2_PLEWA|nr:hypothetical protein NDU88_001114 [Pleurodeles waltl]